MKSTLGLLAALTFVFCAGPAARGADIPAAGGTQSRAEAGETRAESAVPSSLPGYTAAGLKELAAAERELARGAVRRGPRYDSGAAPQSFAPDAVFDVKKYGARGDAVTLSGASVASRSNALTITGPNAALAAADVGKVVVVNGAGPGGADLVTTIAAVADPRRATLAAAASTSVTGRYVIYGTNDTAAIQTALNAACVRASANPTNTATEDAGADVFFPPGVYLVTSLTLRPSGAGLNALYNLRVLGVGGASRIATISPTADVLTFKGDSPNAFTTYNCAIRDLYFRPAVTRTDGFEIVVERGYLFTITDIRFFLNWGCIRLGGVTSSGPTEGVYLERIKAYGFKYGLKTYGVISLWHRGADWSSYRLDATAIWLDSYTEGCTFESLEVSNPRYTEPGNTGIALRITHTNAAISPPRHLKFVGVFFDSHATGLQAEAGQDVSFTECFFHATGNGVWVLGAATDAYSFNSCTVRGSGMSGVLFEAGRNHALLNSRVVGNNTSATGGSGVVLFAGVPGVRVEGNLVTNSWGTGGSQNYGIWIRAGADNFIVTGNDARGNQGANLQNDAGAGPTKIVANNLT